MFFICGSIIIYERNILIIDEYTWNTHTAIYLLLYALFGLQPFSLVHVYACGLDGISNFSDTF